MTCKSAISGHLNRFAGSDWGLILPPPQTLAIILFYATPLRGMRVWLLCDREQKKRRRKLSLTTTIENFPRIDTAADRSFFLLHTSSEPPTRHDARIAGGTSQTFVQVVSSCCTKYESITVTAITSRLLARPDSTCTVSKLSGDCQVKHRRSQDFVCGGALFAQKS